MGFTHERGDGRSEHFIKGCYYYQVYVVSVGSEQHVCSENSRSVIDIEAVVNLFSSDTWDEHLAASFTHWDDLCPSAV